MEIQKFIGHIIQEYTDFFYFSFMILVTGGTGLVGSHLLYHLLIEEDTVKAIHQKTSDLNAVKKVFSYYNSDFEKLFRKIIWVEAELNDISSLAEAFELVTHVYHCAAMVSFDPADYQKMRKTNIEGTSNIVNFCISNSIEKLCFVSSIATVEKDKKSFINELGSWNNTKLKSGYAITKYGSEMEIWRASQEGVSVVIVNPGIILGSGFWEKGSGKMFNQIYKGLPFYSNGITGFVGVVDVVKIMQKLMKSNIKNERFILVSQNVSFQKIFFEIADALNKKRPYIKLNIFLAEIAWRLDYLKSKIIRTSRLMGKSSARTINSKRYYSSEKIKKALSVEFRPIENTIRSICKDFIQK